MRALVSNLLSLLDSAAFTKGVSLKPMVEKATKSPPEQLPLRVSSLADEELFTRFVQLMDTQNRHLRRP